jgi:hypothetical protein
MYDHAWMNWCMQMILSPCNGDSKQSFRLLSDGTVQFAGEPALVCQCNYVTIGIFSSPVLLYACEPSVYHGASAEYQASDTIKVSLYMHGYSW